MGRPDQISVFVLQHLFDGSIVATPKLKTFAPLGWGGWQDRATPRTTMGLVVHARLGAAHTSLLAASFVATVAMRSDAFIVDKLTESGVSGPASGMEHCMQLCSYSMH
jgi:hypothetical protein